jgi:UPF0716 protein FxsA
MRLFLVPLLLLGWPLAEIAGFVLVGRAVGFWGTLGLVVGTAILGGLLMRSQGMHLLRQISQEGREGRMPGRAVVDGAMIVVAGVLLLLPGFITDIIGILLFIPGVRGLIWSAIGRRIVVVSSGQRGFTSRDQDASQRKEALGPVFDLDEQEFHRRPSSPSPWTPPDQKNR